jgi:hypothetical protein
MKMDFTRMISQVVNNEASLQEILELAYNNGKCEAKKTYKPSEYKIVRTYSAGVFYGVVESENGKEVVMRNARRVWYWDGAASLSQLAVDGTSKPDKCNFPVAVDRIKLTEAIEIIDMTEKALNSLNEVAIWER